MISVSRLSVHFSGNYLFDEISFNVNPNDRIGLVGKNGAGKSTLLKILAGQFQAESGQVSYPKGYTVGYLAQDIAALRGKTVYDETVSALKELKQLEHAIEDLQHRISESTDYESEAYHKLVDDLSEFTERFAHMGGYNIRGTVEAILGGLGFEHDDLDRLTDEFSGGWQMRIELAKILVARPSCILLDEPTNHLDIDSVQWLEKFLRNYDGAIVLVSHDRAFLDAVTNRTIEITLGNIEDYPCSYTKYVVQRAERREQTMAAYRNQQKEIEKTQEFIDRFRYKASLASRVQSRVKMLERIDKIEIEEEDKASIRFTFPPAPRSGEIVCEASGLSKAYGSRQVLKPLHFLLTRGEKMAFVGRNGEGKSTFSRILAGIESYDGPLKVGHNVKVAYFAQQQAEALDGDDTVLETIDSVAQGEIRTRIRSLLGAFLFSGDDVYKKVKVLSGGEKGRLALCRLLLEPSNLLILDEPTNHLDMRSKDVLKAALQKYEGAMVVVSHDRDFLQGLTDSVVEFKSGALKVYPGDINEYLRQKELDSLDALNASRQANQAAKAASVAANTQDSAKHREAQKQKERDRKKLEKEMATVESAIERLEARKLGLEVQMQDSEFFSNSALSQKTQKEYQDLVAQLEKSLREWERIGELLETE